MIRANMPICGDSGTCIYQEGEGRVRMCKILDVKFGAPYPDGKCKYRKQKYSDKSGYTTGDYERSEMVWTRQ